MTQVACRQYVRPYQSLQSCRDFAMCLSPVPSCKSMKRNKLGISRKFRAEQYWGPVAGGGDWYVWHAPDGPRARAATALGCVQAGAEKLGVLEASYASAIIGVLSPVSSHCLRYGGAGRLAGNQIVAQGPQSADRQRWWCSPVPSATKWTRVINVVRRYASSEEIHP
jgi:hypothetical protein